MQAGKGNQPRRARPSDEPTNTSTGRVREHIVGLFLEATRFIAPSRVEETALGWLARADLGLGSPGLATALVAEAFALALNLAVFTPSASGATAFDRLARQRSGMAGDEAAALQSLRRAQFKLLRVEATGRDGVARLRDLTSGEVLEIVDQDIRPEAAGVTLVAWLVVLGDGRQAFAGGATPLDAAGLAVANGFVRPGRPGLVNPLRCAEAVYRHVLRHGTLEIPGLNRPALGEEDDPPEEVDELDRLALRWAEPNATRDADDVQFVRSQANLGAVLDILAATARARAHGRGPLSDAYAAIALIQLETVHRRASAGSGTVGLDTVAAALDRAIAAGRLPRGAREVFGEVRRKLGGAPAGSKDAELDRLIGRIQALRAKTVEQGCTEQEALAAAEKVAELLDRYGLSLSELDLRRQTCEGSAVETERRRAGPVDDCVPAAAAFFDCRVWSEKNASGMLRYVFFGLPADVAAARYLYDLIEQAFETETARFRAGKTYAAAPTGLRRTASNSFQIGLGRGITAKLHSVRQAREATLRRASGRDLVVVKASIVETELAALGLQLRARNRSGGRRVLRDVFEQGHEAGLGFEYTPGVGHSS